MSSHAVLRLATCFLLASSLNLSAHDGHGVRIESVNDDESICVYVDGEFFAAMQRSNRWKKPFFYPVSRPGWSAEPFEAGHAITIAETVVLDGEKKVGTIPPGTKVSVAATMSGDAGGQVYSVPDYGGVVSASAVVPESALIVRTMQDAPMPYQRRNHNAYDHPHHRGVWVSVDEVNGLKFWNEGGVIRPDAVTVKRNVITVTNSWLDESGQPLIQEQTRYTISPSRLIGAAIQFKNVSDEPVRFEDTKEGLFGVRIATPLRERDGGVITDASGRETEADVWGRENLWVDYSGEKSGAAMGVTIFDSPTNPRPGRYHVRGYGLFSISPFGPHAYSKNVEPKNPLVLQSNESTTFNYGLWIHGRTNADQINAIAGAFSRLVSAD